MTCFICGCVRQNADDSKPRLLSSECRSSYEMCFSAIRGKNRQAANHGKQQNDGTSGRYEERWWAKGKAEVRELSLRKSNGGLLVVRHKQINWLAGSEAFELGFASFDDDNGFRLDTN